MLFSSAIFILFFLPAVLIIYSLNPSIRWKNGVLLTSSLLFYFWGEGLYTFVLLFSIVSNFLFGILIDRTQDGRKRNLWTILAIATNLALILYYKYFTFFTSLVGETPAFAKNIHLPLGISFFVFQGISYVVDIKHKKIAAQAQLTKMALFKVFFPQLIAGPIVRYVDIADQIYKRASTLAYLSYGAERFILGLAKKCLIANYFGLIADQVFSLTASEVTTFHSWLGAISYTFQIYFDFSGYSDMAIGLAALFGFQIKENFLLPYSSRSITEFWRKWHISLSSWFRDYLYIPLGGNKNGSFRTYRNLLFVFLLCGFWHGANWTFVVWGLYHGLFLVLERLEPWKMLMTRIKYFQPVYTWLVFLTGWILFRSENLSQALMHIRNLYWFHFSAHDNTLIPEHQNYEFYFLTLVAFCFSTVDFKVIKHDPTQGSALINKFGVGGVAVLSILFLTALASIAANTFNPFIYFRF